MIKALIWLFQWWAYRVEANQILRLKYLKWLKYWGGTTFVKNLILEKLVFINIAFLFIAKYIQIKIF